MSAVVVNPTNPIHMYIQSVLTRWLSAAAGELGWAHSEFSYRLRSTRFPVYAPPLIVEVLSPSNRVLKFNRQRLVALSAGTQEFWAFDPEAQTIEVSRPSASTITYGITGTIPLTVLPGAEFPVRLLFE